MACPHYKNEVSATGCGLCAREAYELKCVAYDLLKEACDEALAVGERYKAALERVAEANSGDGVDEFAAVIRAAKEALGG
jgi:hypothetical protein